ncbi:hypothetical protein TCAL_11848 [Tigriopus californicus]|uniref:Uncharacterized protein n=1 Tax=Tigriopus californicus TaxID=6832 RepID=A0A553PU46_TIGCA|nr:uncharacterized protein LOC131891244 [Tigriopus californicus]TRY81177.1 hypothetical protein TCAL_11848 [Tigriopus californicus]|eukprot:TCALIF_11848-PA protein Name:"Protein of unknown function" AED:0.27 eAED:0.27 QI:7/0.5/0.33/0.66/1/1/3/0/243
MNGFVVHALAAMALVAQLVLTEHLPRSNLLSRTRRFIFDDPNTWEGEVILALSIPIGPLGTSLGLDLPFAFTLGGGDSSARDLSDYTFDHNLVRKRRSSQRSGRALQSPHNLMDHSFHEDKRTQLAREIENYATQYLHIDGHACMLRALCEMAQVPLHSSGFIGDLMNLLVTPNHILDALVESPSTPNEYVQAQISGRHWDDCSHLFGQCTHSLFKFVDTDMFAYGFGNQTWHTHHVERNRAN